MGLSTRGTAHGIDKIGSDIKALGKKGKQKTSKKKMMISRPTLRVLQQIQPQVKKKVKTQKKKKVKKYQAKNSRMAEMTKKEKSREDRYWSMREKSSAYQGNPGVDRSLRMIRDANEVSAQTMDRLDTDVRFVSFSLLSSLKMRILLVFAEDT